MSNLPLSQDLKELFENVTNGRGDDANVRAILVQNDNGQLRLVKSLPAEASDRDDFEQVLGKLFSAEPTRPGYALFRLDSKSSAGLSEWINCAYRPEGAKVREKMQYTLTQASLTQGLSEQHFLETIYGASANEFSFPQSLRNARKHDYQNPQVSSRGKTAAEAAGGSIGGARRTFDMRGSAGTAKTETPNPSDDAKPSSEERPAFPSSMTEDGTAAPSTGVGEVGTPGEATQAKSAMAQDSTSLAEESNAKTAEPARMQSSVEPPHADLVNGSRDKIEQVEMASQKPDALGEIANAAGGITAQTQEAEKAEAESSIAPSSQPALSEAAPDKSSEMTSVNATSADVVANAPVGATITGHASQQADSAREEATKAQAAPKATQSNDNSTGIGRGEQGLETERERELASLKAQENEARAGAGTGGPRTGLAWDGDVEPAIRGLAKKGVMSTTAEWNLVVLRLDLAKELVQLAMPPRMAMPGDIAGALKQAITSSEAQQQTEPCYALYAHPQAQSEESATASVGLIYVCPMHSTVRQRMIYSSNLASLATHSSSFEGLEIVKRLETADPDDLTMESLVEAFAPESSGQNVEPGAAAFSRPKRPGRK